MSEHKQLVQLYHDALGYDPQSWTREHKGAKRILDMGFSPSDAMTLYDELKATRFWSDKHLSLTYIAQQLPAWIANKPKPIPADDQLENWYMHNNPKLE